jgi:hypothetical protein
MSGKDERGLTVLKNRTVTQKLGSVMFAGLMVLTAGVTMAAAPASASNCTTTLAEREIAGPNEFQAGASCANIDDGYKARVGLDREVGPDYFTPWFTTENTAHFTGWHTCLAGCTDVLQFRPI